MVHQTDVQLGTAQLHRNFQFSVKRKLAKTRGGLLPRRDANRQREEGSSNRARTPESDGSESSTDSLMAIELAHIQRQLEDIALSTSESSGELRKVKEDQQTIVDQIRTEIKSEQVVRALNALTTEISKMREDDRKRSDQERHLLKDLTKAIDYNSDQVKSLERAFGTAQAKLDSIHSTLVSQIVKGSPGQRGVSSAAGEPSRKRAATDDRKYPQQACIFCSGVHAAEKCTEFTDWSSRTMQLLQKGICIKCFRSENHAKCEKSRRRCQNCREIHHNSLCKDRSILLLGSLFYNGFNSQLVSITSSNHDEIMQNSRLTFVSFTSSWCPFSKKLMPTLSQSALYYKQKYPDRKTIWGNVDCVDQGKLCGAYQIGKYPTTKVFFYGHMMVEYRGSRQTRALVEYVEKMENTSGLVELKEVESVTQWQTRTVPQKGTLIVWFPRHSPPFELILKAIALIHDQLTVVAPAEGNSLEHEEHKLWFSLDGEHVQTFNGTVTHFKEIVEWVRQRSVGMVRELTFGNAEEMAEDGRPMLVLFRKKDDKDIDTRYIQTIRRELNETLLSLINPLLADGDLMAKVLVHFNRSPGTLPFLVIDQFVHSYPAPWIGDEIFEEGNIRKFVIDLLNNTHHKRLHEMVKKLLRKLLSETEKMEKEAVEKTTTEPFKDIKKHESVFNKLKPAKNRYSFSKQEL
ncbi:unnamed protein product [Caenorhabditis sp. 36 PRJEB53466]|nr:unnamed protein product [Caenorhabditis sp. 36 PRJEB53466]